MKRVASGASPNQTWYLVAQDMATGDTGYIDFFELWVTYDSNDAPNTPSNEDPGDGDTGVSRTANLDWSCSDPDGDPLYYTVYFEKNDSSPDTIIKNDSTGSSADPGTMDYSSHYYWRVKADDHNGGVTWGPVWDFYTEAEAVIEATITIQSLTSAIQGELLTVNCDVRNDGNVTHSFGVGAEIKDGTTVVADLGQRTASSVGPGSTKTVTFTYTIPEGWTAKDYTLHTVVWSGTPGSSDWLDDDNETFGVVARNVDASITIDPIAAEQAGNSVSILYEVTNDGNVFHAFGVGAEIWKDGVKQDDVGSQTTASASPGGTTSGSFSYDIPSSWHGTYTARCAVWSGTPGSSIWLDSYDRDFTVNPASLPTLTGRIAFHRDSDNNTLHAPINGDDGHIYVYDLNAGGSPTKVTAGLPIGNAMNPHFSPDGSKIAFMAILTGDALLSANMHVYVLDLAEGDLRDLGSGQDPKFSPDGNFIVFKKSSQIWRMHPDGSSAVALTSTGGEKSGPNYSPDGTKIVYWLNGGSSADIWLMNADGSGGASIVANASIQDYYPIYRDGDNILYARWDSATPPHPDKVYNIELSSGTSIKLGLNSVGTSYEDADPFPVQDLVGFSSTRKKGWPDYDLYVAADSGSPFGELSSANSTLGELGGVYSPYTYSRKLKMQALPNEATLTAGASYTLEVRAYSDGSTWAGANPTVIFTGPDTVLYTGLKDDGTQGDVTPGDGVYSKTVSLPATPGSYSVSARAQSVEPGVSRQVVSSAVTVDIDPANSTPTDIDLSSTSVTENEPSGTTVGTLSTTDPDTEDSFTYTLASGNGDADNGSFTIVGDQLRTAASFNYEAKNSYTIRIRTTDQGGLWYEKIFIIMVEDETLKGDINNDEIVNIEDAILGLRVLSSSQSQEPINLLADVDSDGKIDMEEVIYIFAKNKWITSVNSANRVAGGFSPPSPTPPRMRVRTGRFTEVTGL